MLSNVKALLHTAKAIAKQGRQAFRHERVYSRYKDYTMIGRQEYISNLGLALSVLSHEGAIVECGTWKGGMIAGIADVLGSKRDYYLFDSFAGLPPAKEIDGVGAIQWQMDVTSDRYFNNCTAKLSDAQRAMSLSCANTIHIVEGWFEDSLPISLPSQNIALLRLDCDWYDSTMTCLEYLFPKVIVNGIIVLDDYYTWDGCSKALHDYLSKYSRLERIMQHNQICYLVKRHD